MKTKKYYINFMKDLITCPAERAIYFLGGKWKIRILFMLYENKKIRFNVLKKVLKTIRNRWYN